MAYSRLQGVQTGPSSGATANLSLPPFSNNVGAGNRLILLAAVYNTLSGLRIGSVTAGQTLSWNLVERLADADFVSFEIWEAYVQTGGSCTVTVHANVNTFTQWSVFCYEFSGLLIGTASTASGTNGSTYSSPSNPILSGACSPVSGQDGELAIGLIGDGGYPTVYSANAGWTQIDTPADGGGFPHGVTLSQDSVSGLGSNASANSTAVPTNGTGVVATFQLASPPPAGGPAGGTIGITGTYQHTGNQ